MGKLFAEPDQAAAHPAAAPRGRVVALAVAANLWRTFDYLWPDALGTPTVGQRVRVPFGRGNRTTLAFVVDPDRAPPARELKIVREVIDQASQFDPVLWELGHWISEYYLAPLGMTLAAMIPSAVGKHAPKSETVAFLTSRPGDWPASLGPRQRRVLDELHEARKQGVEPLTLQEVLSHSGAAGDSVRRLQRRELLRLESRPVRLGSLEGQVDDDPFELNADQKAVLKALAGKLAGAAGAAAPGKNFSATLLYGVTGSGKTEVYIRAAREVIAAGRQVIILVPEIALATQTLQRLIKRLPRVAVLHSGLTSSQRAFYYEQIRDGHAAAVVGPRSAVFAPARKLGLIVVDEEHEASYKQDTVPRYHGRDVAVKRAALSGVPVLLGSATPSLESLHNARQGRYEMLRLPNRVRGLAMPKLEIVSLRKEIQPGRIELIGRTLMLRMAAALDRAEQVILLMNRRGYASHVFCPSCKWVFSCEQCTRAMVYHQATQLVLCHYCQHTATLPEQCPACGGKILLFGLGIQRIENELARKFPTARVARMDSDTMTSPKQFRKVFDDFAAGELDILLGTQMVAKGLDFPRVSLVGVVSADTSLAIPDFRASERTFQLIVQVAGRAGRGEKTGQVVVQTLHEDEPAVIFASRHDYDGFAEWDLAHRREMNLPPMTRLVRFLARHADATKAQAGANVLAGRLREILPGDEVVLTGPLPAPVPKIRGLFRFQILLTVARAGLVQRLVGPVMDRISRESPAEIVCDVDPIHLL